MSVVLVTESDADPILWKLQCRLCKQLLSPSNSPDACKTHLKSTVCQGHHLVPSEGGSDSPRAAASGIRQQQQRADRRHQLQTPGDAAARSAADWWHGKDARAGEGASCDDPVQDLPPPQAYWRPGPQEMLFLAWSGATNMVSLESANVFWGNPADFLSRLFCVWTTRKEVLPPLSAARPSRDPCWTGLMHRHVWRLKPGGCLERQAVYVHVHVHVILHGGMCTSSERVRVRIS